MMPPAARNLFEKRFLDFQKLFINEKFLQGVQGGSFFKKRPPGRRRQKKEVFYGDIGFVE